MLEKEGDLQMAETNMKEVKQQLEDQFVHFQTIKNIPVHGLKSS